MRSINKRELFIQAWDLFKGNAQFLINVGILIFLYVSWGGRAKRGPGTRLSHKPQTLFAQHGTLPPASLKLAAYSISKA